MTEVLAVAILAAACGLWFYIDRASGGSCAGKRCGSCGGGSCPKDTGPGDAQA